MNECEPLAVGQHRASECNPAARHCGVGRALLRSRQGAGGARLRQGLALTPRPQPLILNSVEVFVPTEDRVPSRGLGLFLVKMTGSSDCTTEGHFDELYTQAPSKARAPLKAQIPLRPWGTACSPQTCAGTATARGAPTGSTPPPRWPTTSVRRCRSTVSKPVFQAPGTKRLKLKHDKLLSNFAFKFCFQLWRKTTL